ncbi:hypothetical protein mRhiFer1_009009 [Rhinolophus ferrumequinum]|uniref:Uncharacterized protein n=1 Tax=Rhinolophus ferrumequinum TaxID=59479 RepID=A0A7J7SXX8_RHIFE|nr:hypothetical protein mRhiFer1_009009 [Rhinolophus ferrumequinum]
MWPPSSKLPGSSALCPPLPPTQVCSLHIQQSRYCHSRLQILAGSTCHPFPALFLPVPARGRPTFFLKQSGLLSRKSTTVSTLRCPSCSATTDTWLLSPPILPHAALYVLSTGPYQTTFCFTY